MGTSCNSSNNEMISQHTIGIINYENDDKSLKQYEGIKQYLASELNSSIEIEPAYNEVRALQQISTNK